MSNEVQKYQGGQVAEYTRDDVIRQVTKIQEIMKTVMKKDEHYGVIPGCGDKPTLLKSGAEKLAFTFRLAPDFQIEQTDQQNEHREYRIVTRITNSVTGDFLGSGVGAASTMETKWRYRSENTGQTVPKEYWDTRDQSLLGGMGFSARKMGKDWMIVHKVEHDNPADYYNTCLKMAKKRSLVDAILTCTAASDLFSQDLEELKENGVLPEEHVETVKPEIHKPQPKAKKPEAVKSGDTVTAELPKPVIKKGEGKKGPWVKYGVCIDDTWYGTFDREIQAVIDSAVGEKCVLTFESDGKYNTITNIEPALDEPEMSDHGDAYEGSDELPL